MEHHDHSLAWMFGVRAKKPGEHRLDDDAVKAITQQVTLLLGVLAGPTSPTVIASVVECVATALKTSIREIALSAWNKRAEVRKYADLTKYPAGQQHEVVLYEHPVKWTYKPYVEIRTSATPAPMAAPSLEIAIDVTLNFAQAVLVIDGGKIMSLKPGKVTAQGSAKIGGAKLCEPIKKELGELPGTWPLGDGIPIGKDPLQPVAPGAGGLHLPA